MLTRRDLATFSVPLADIDANGGIVDDDSTTSTALTVISLIASIIGTMHGLSQVFGRGIGTKSIEV